MPSVPLPSGSLNTAAAPAQTANAPSQAFGASVLGEGLTSIAGAVDSGAKDLQARATQLQAITNKADADNAYSTYLQKSNDYLFNPQSGYYNTRQKGAIDGYPQAIKDLAAMRDDVANSLSSPMAKQEFDSNSRKQLAYTLSDVSRHASTEQKSYVKQASQNVIDASTQTAVANWNNPQALQSALDDQWQQVLHLHAANGDDLQTAQLAQKEQQSSTLVTVAKTIAENDPVAAKKFVDEHSDSFTPTDGVAIHKYVKTVAEPIENAAIAQQVWRGAKGPAIGTDISTGSWYKSGILPQEGGLNADGTPRTSQTGAQGAAQMEPATAARLKAQHPGLPDYNPADAKVSTQYGQTYYNDLVTKFDGNQVLATAAYNAGPQAVQDWINGTNHKLLDGKFTNPNHKLLGTPQPGDELNWAGTIPYGETKNYVLKVIANTGGGAPSVDDKLADAIPKAQQVAEQVAPNDPLRQERIVAQVQKFAGQEKAAETAASKATYSKLIDAANGGPSGTDSKPIDIADLLHSYPGAAADFAALPSGLRTALQNQVKGNLNATNANPSPQNIENFNYFNGMAHSDPAKFAALSPESFTKSDLTPRQQQQLMKLQGDVATKPPPGAKELQTALSNPQIALSVRSVFSHGKDDDVGNADKDKEKLQFMGALSGRLSSLSSAGKPVSPQEMVNEANNLLAEYGQKQGGMFGSGAQSGHRGYAVPANDLPLITDAFKAKHGRAPNQSEVAAIYFRTHNATR